MSCEDESIFSCVASNKIKTEKVDENKLEDSLNQVLIFNGIKPEPNPVPNIGIKDEEIKVKDELKEADSVGIEEESECVICVQFRNKLENLVKEKTESNIIKQVNKEFEKHKADNRACEEKKFLCNECGKKFFWSKELKRHKIQNHRYYKCELCPKKFADPVSMTSHKKYRHKVLQVYNCDLCNEAFFSVKGLFDHEKSHLEIKNSKRCSNCKRKFENNHELESHRCFMFVCYVCQKGFNQEKKYMTHNCNNPKPFQCEICGKVFAVEGWFKLHEKNSHLKEAESNKTFECQICKKLYKSKKGLISHQKTHVSNNQCDVCKRNFATKGLLKYHYLSHKAIECFNLGQLKF